MHPALSPSSPPRPQNPESKALHFDRTLGLQIAQSRYYVQTLDPKVGTVCILGALGELVGNPFGSMKNRNRITATVWFRVRSVLVGFAEPPPDAEPQPAEPKP